MKLGLLATVGLTVVTATAFGVAVSCESHSKLDVVIEEGASAPHANIPGVPTLPQPAFPVQYSDGAYSVYGVRHMATRNWSKQVSVRGWIVKVYVPMVPHTNPPRPCTGRDHCVEEKPHIYIADTADETDPEKLIMVTGYANFQSEIDQARASARSGHAATPAATVGTAITAHAEPAHGIPTDFLQGAQIAAAGTFRRRASNGEGDSNGLIEYINHTTVTPAPSGSTRRH